MPDPSKRIIVDGIDPSSFLYFLRILKAVGRSFHPPRLIIGLLMALAIATFGTGWDKMFDASISRHGLMAGHFDEAEASLVQTELRNIMRQWALTEDYKSELPDDQWPLLDARDVYKAVQRGYATNRNPDLGDELKRRDEEYRAALERVMEVSPRGSYAATIEEVTHGFEQTIGASLDADVLGVVDGLVHIAYRTPLALWSQDKIFAIIFGLFLMVVVATGGGAICRMSACEIAGQERLRLRDAIDFAVANRRRFISSLLLPLLIALVPAVLLLALGVLFIFPVGDMLGGILYGIAMLLGLLVSMLVVGYAIGFSLLTPAVACENCDAMDAMTRSFVYIIHRPLQLLGYAVVAVAGLVLGFLVISFLAMMVLNLTAELTGMASTHSAFSVAGGATMFDLNATDPGSIHPGFNERFTAWFIEFWQTIVVNLVIAWVFVYFFSSSTWVYLLMRRSADGQDIEEIWRPGLVPGTLTDMPPPIVDELSPSERSASKAADDAGAESNSDSGADNA